MARTEPNLDIVAVVQTVRDVEGCCVVPALLFVAVDEAAETVVTIEPV